MIYQHQWLNINFLWQESKVRQRLCLTIIILTQILWLFMFLPPESTVQSSPTASSRTLFTNNQVKQGYQVIFWPRSNQPSTWWKSIRTNDVVMTFDNRHSKTTWQKNIFVIKNIKNPLCIVTRHEYLTLRSDPWVSIEWWLK